MKRIIIKILIIIIVIAGCIYIYFVSALNTKRKETLEFHKGQPDSLRVNDTMRYFKKGNSN